MIPLALTLAACARPDTETDTVPLPAVFDVATSTDPAPPVAGEPTELTYTVTKDGQPIEDLQQSHERIVHVVMISRDLDEFAHDHHEDHYPITADDLRTATFHLPHTFGMAGDYFLLFDYASENLYHQNSGFLTVTGAPPMRDAPLIDLSEATDSRDVHAVLSWTVPPVAGQPAAFSVHLTTTDGADVTDITQWLGSDSHVILATTDLSWATHTHAYVPGMENAPPDHVMPHSYPGPDIDFRTQFPSAGTYAMWVQFAREGAPDAPYVERFEFEVQ